MFPRIRRVPFLGLDKLKDVLNDFKMEDSFRVYRIYYKYI